MTTTAPLVSVDSSDCSHVVVCSVCHASWVYLDKAQADAVAQQHRIIERERALPRCSTEGCTEYSVASGLCRPHYNAARYQLRKARLLEAAHS